MKFNIVECYSDQCPDNANFYDCWAKDVFQLVLVKNKPTWVKLKTKKNKCFNNPKTSFCAGNAYGIMRVHREYLYSFDQKDIDILNSFGRIRKDSFKRLREQQEFFAQMQKGMFDFITNQLKKLNQSGVGLISTRHPSYPYRPSETSPYVKDTWFGIAFSCINRKKDIDLFFGNGNSMHGWHPTQIIY